MTEGMLRQALAYASRGWPVFPCQPDQKIPATRHGYRDATTDQERITAWFGHGPSWNLAIATGTPGRPGRRPARPCRARIRSARAPQASRAARRCECMRGHPEGWPSCLLRGYEPAQRPPGRPPLGLQICGGYILAPPSQVHGKPYRLIKTLDGQSTLDWAAVTHLLQPWRQPNRPESRLAMDTDIGRLARWVARQSEGNRNAGLFWAASRALEADRAADLSQLAEAARQAGLTEPEITRTLDSARKTREARPRQPDHDAEASR